MTFDASMQRYVQLVIQHGLNVQPGQIVNISAEVCHADFVEKLVEAAYKAGAKLVNVDFEDPRHVKHRIAHGAKEWVEFVPKFQTAKYEEFVENRIANVRVCGPHDPDLLATVDAASLNRLRGSWRKAIKRFYDDGINKSMVQWCVIAAATPKWAERVFPKLKGEAANKALWEAIFSCCRADKPDCIDLWHKHNDKLHKRAEMLNKMKIEEIHFKGPGTDLTVGLSPKAIFLGGGQKSDKNIEFEPNLPTEEVFTTPDWRKTNGQATATRPFLINGQMIRGLVMHFDKGKLVKFTATEGAETFKQYINTDKGACALGEVALVGVDSPIFASGLTFEEILYDENAACHIAVGMAYRTCVDGGPKMTEAELDAIGCNISNVHTDMMISNEKVDVTAKVGGKLIPLLKNGAWVI